MRLRSLVVSTFAFATFPFPSLSSAMSHALFIGTYTNSGSKGIYAVSFDPATGRFDAPQVAAETTSPTYLAFSPDQRHLYAVSESAGMAVGFAVSADRTQLTPLDDRQPAAGKAPCHLMTDRTGRVLFVSNYHTGTVGSIPIAPDGRLRAPATLIQHTGSSVDPDRQTSPHAHSVTVSPDNRFVFACDLGTDKIYIYKIDLATATLQPHDPAFVSTPAGVGPRHFAFSPDGAHAFMISEMGGTLTSYRYDAERGTLHPLDTQSTLSAEFPGKNKSAAVRVHPNGRFVYGSNRGPDTIAVFRFEEGTGRLSLVEIVPCGGPNPRDFALSPDGRWLIVAHQDAGTLKAFRVDSETGRLTATDAVAQVPAPVCVLFAN